MNTQESNLAIGFLRISAPYQRQQYLMNWENAFYLKKEEITDGVVKIITGKVKVLYLK